jgi:hypothetical protein
MAKFIVLVGYEGPVTAEYFDRPATDPAQFGPPGEDNGSRDDSLVGQNIISYTHYRHDFAALHAVPTRIVVGRFSAWSALIGMVALMPAGAGALGWFAKCLVR